MVKCSVAVLLVCALSSVGCVSAVESDEPNIGSAALAAGSFNGLGWDSLATEDVSTPYYHPYGAAILEGTVRADLINNTLNSLPSSVKNAIVNDGWSGELFGYIVKCALPEGSEIPIAGAPGTPYLGRLGLVPSWGTGTCGSTCQHKMTACILAHANVDDAPEDIGVVASWGPVEAASAYDTYTKPEAAYFGNIFASTPRRYACYNGPISATMGILRVCHACTSSDCTCRDETVDSRVVLKGSGANNQLQGCISTCNDSTPHYKIAGDVNSKYYDDCTVDGVLYSNVVTVRQH